MSENPEIREWVERTFSGPGSKMFLELGACRGEDTEWLSKVPGSTVYAFEPDPRNHAAFVEPTRPRDVWLYNVAISDHDGSSTMFLSETGWGKEWTYSSSLKAPKGHLLRFPVTFDKQVCVNTMRLDTVHQHLVAGRPVDFIWADIQGAEGDMIRGGTETLKRTHYLYTEYSDEEMYEGQVTLAEILAMLPEWRIVKQWPTDVLLENTQWSARVFEGVAA